MCCVALNGSVNQHHCSMHLFWMSPKELSGSPGCGALGFSTSLAFCSSFLILITWLMRHFSTPLQMIYIYTIHILYVWVLIQWYLISLEAKWKTSLLKEIIHSALSPGWSLFPVVSAPSFLLSRLEGRYFVFFSSQSCHRAPSFHAHFDIIWPLQNLVSFQWFLCRLLLWSLCMWFIPKYDLTAVEI